jgi:hypothetical protein
MLFVQELSADVGRHRVLLEEGRVEEPKGLLFLTARVHPCGLEGLALDPPGVQGGDRGPGQGQGVGKALDLLPHELIQELQHLFIGQGLDAVSRLDPLLSNETPIHPDDEGRQPDVRGDVGDLALLDGLGRVGEPGRKKNGGQREDQPPTPPPDSARAATHAR